MASTVFFSAVAESTDPNAELDRTAIDANITSATRTYSGQNASGGLSEFAAWKVGGGALDGSKTVALSRLVDDGDSNSWLLITTLNSTTSRVQMVIPNGTYRVATTNIPSDEIMVVLQGI